MGIGPPAIAVTRVLYERGLLEPGFTVMELGSQDFAPTWPAAWEAIAAEFAFQDWATPECRFEKRLPEEWYRRLGASRYESIDLDEAFGARPLDLNYNIAEHYKFSQQFDLVTNHGTTEHLLNQFTAFENIHNLTRPGGIIVHGVPFQGYQNHGFFRYNPSFFSDLAVSNHYDELGVFLSMKDDLFPFDEDFVARNQASSGEDITLYVLLRRTTDQPFRSPYDERYFPTSTAPTSGREGVAPLTRSREHRTVVSVHRPLFPGRAYHFITPLWGLSYARDFLAITLPSELAQGNLGAFQRDEAGYTIVTTLDVQRLIEASPEYEALEAMMPVEFIIHGAKPGEHAYERMTRAYNLALMRVQQPQTCFFLTADDFYSNGLFTTARTVMDGGKRAVMVPTMRVVRDSFRGDIQVNGTYDLGGRELVGLILRHEHPLSTACVINERRQTVHRLPACTLYRMDNGYVGRWNVMHPLAIKLPAHPRRIDATIDWNYPVLALSNPSELYVLRDSDDGIIASLSPYTYSQSEPIRTSGGRRRRVRNLKDWVNLGWTLNFHLVQMDEPVYLHVGDRQGPEWDRGIAAVDSIWGPFRRYIQRHRVEIPERTRGSGVELLTQAVKPQRAGKVVRLAPVAARRLLRKLWRRAYRGASRRLAEEVGSFPSGDDDLLPFDSSVPASR